MGSEKSYPSGKSVRSELRSVFLRCEKAAFTTFLNSSSSTGSSFLSLRINRSTLDLWRGIEVEFAYREEVFAVIPATKKH